MKKSLLPLCAACLAYAALLLSRPAVATAAVRTSLIFCAEKLIPALLPFLFISALFLNTGALNRLGKLLAPVTGRLFRLPEICGGVILFSLIGGYPVGLAMAGNLVKSGEIPPEDARRMTRFCLNPGPAFVVLGIGQGLFGDGKIGWILFASLITSALLIGLILPRKTAKSLQKLKKIQCSPPTPRNLGDCFSEAIRHATSQMLNICVFTILFATICGFLPLFLPNSHVIALTNALLEVSAGTAAAAGYGSIAAMAAVLAWGGLCVHLQCLSAIIACGQSFLKFIFWRVFHAALAALVCRVLLIFFPLTVTETSLSVNAVPAASLWQISALSALGLAAMGVGVLVEVFRNEDTGGYTTPQSAKPSSAFANAAKSSREWKEISSTPGFEKSLPRTRIFRPKPSLRHNSTSSK